MSRFRRNALIGLAVWIPVTLGCALLFWSGSGPAGFADEDQRWRRLLMAVPIGLGLVVHFWLLWSAREARRTGEYDERDASIARRASEATLIVLGVCVYALGMVLFETYRDGGVAPVGWFYLISYGTLCFMGIIYPVATLLLDLRGSIDG